MIRIKDERLPTLTTLSLLNIIENNNTVKELPTHLEEIYQKCLWIYNLDFCVCVHIIENWDIIEFQRTDIKETNNALIAHYHVKNYTYDSLNICEQYVDSFLENLDKGIRTHIGKESDYSDAKELKKYNIIINDTSTLSCRELLFLTSVGEIRITLLILTGNGCYFDKCVEEDSGDIHIKDVLIVLWKQNHDTLNCAIDTVYYDLERKQLFEILAKNTMEDWCDVQLRNKQSNFGNVTDNMKCYLQHQLKQYTTVQKIYQKTKLMDWVYTTFKKLYHEHNKLINIFTSYNGLFKWDLHACIDSEISDTLDISFRRMAQECIHCRTLAEKNNLCFMHQ